MKVLTIQSIETLEQESQQHVHSIFRMEHHTDYIFRSKEASQYSATISMNDTSETIELIIKNSGQVPEYTFIIDNLDTEAKKIQRIKFQSGKVLETKEGNWDWKE